MGNGTVGGVMGRSDEITIADVKNTSGDWSHIPMWAGEFLLMTYYEY